MKAIERKWSLRFYFWMWKLARFIFKNRCSIWNLENIPAPEHYSNGLIIAANHNDASNIPVLAILFPPEKPIHFVMAYDLFESMLMRFIGERCFAIPVYRSSQSLNELDQKLNNRINLRFFRTAISVLEKGGIVGIFPEGGIFDRTNPTHKDREGIIKLAQKTNALILPIYIERIKSGIVLPLPGGFSIGNYRIIIRKPVTIDDLGLLNTRSLMNLIYNNEPS